MRNIQVLPTDKPSRLAGSEYITNVQGIDKRVFKFKLWNKFIDNKDLKAAGYIPHNIYITSDEEIQEGVNQWYLDKFLNKPYRSGGAQYGEKQNVIILTTDTDLIKDGVQALEDEFLQWFVQNPSCEKVEVQKWSSLAECGYSYHIIIPKEEPKKIYYNTVGRENGVNVVKGQFNTQKEALDLANELNRKFPDLYYDWRETLIKEEPKQETLTYTESAKKEERIFNYRIMKQAHENARPAKETLEHSDSFHSVYKIIIPKKEPKQEYEYIGDCKGNNGNGCFMDSCGHDCGCYVRIPKPTDEKRRLMTELNKSKLYLILSVMVGFTLVNIIKDNNWVGYLLSLVVFPLITWGLIELLFKYKSK
jgi:hypothetical protein